MLSQDDVESIQRNLFQPPHLQLLFTTFQLDLGGRFYWERSYLDFLIKE